MLFKKKKKKVPFYKSNKELILNILHIQKFKCS